MSAIVAIGGGDMAGGENLPIDQRIVALSGARRPRALYIGTAGGDDPDKIAEFHAHYGGRLGCETEALTLLRERPAKARMAALIGQADLIYVGGGNSLRMMKLWRRTGVDALLAEARARGCVLAGLSAGGMCWFRYGYSASRRYSSPEDWGYIRIRALGFVNAIFCAHAVVEQRLPSFRDFMRSQRCVGLALDDHCAIEIRAGQWRLLRSRPDAAAERLWQRGGRLFSERLATGGRLAALLQR